jgi:hypothetical protein
MANFTTTGSDTFPAGHVIKHATVGEENHSSGHIATSSASFEDTGLEVAITTAASSANSYLVFEYWGGMFNCSATGSGFMAAPTMRTVSNSTYTAGELIYTASYPTYVSQLAYMYYPISIRMYCGLVSGMGMPATKSSWSAGDTLYFRLFMMQQSGDGTAFVHNTSSYNLSVTEISR